MRRVAILGLLAAVTTVGSFGFSQDAEARGWRHRHVHIKLGFKPYYPVYPAYCRWYRTHYGLVKRCWY